MWAIDVLPNGLSWGREGKKGRRCYFYAGLHEVHVLKQKNIIYLLLFYYRNIILLPLYYHWEKEPGSLLCFLWKVATLHYICILRYPLVGRKQTEKESSNRKP